MKKNLLLFCTLLFAIPIVISFKEGERIMLAGTGKENRTGNPTHGGYPTVTGCSSGTGCHDTVTVTPFTLNFALTDISVTPNVLSTGIFTPGHKYIVKISGAYSSEPTPALPSFGFQCSLVGWMAGSDRFHGTPAAVRRGSPAEYAWNPFTNKTPSTTDTFAISGTYLIENTNRITDHGSSSVRSSWEATFYWQAPDTTAADTIGFWYVLCAVDSDGTSANDVTFMGPRDGVIYVNGDSLENVNSVFNNIHFSCYPNPLKDQLHISMNNLQRGSYTFSVFDISGRRLLTQDFNINSASFNTQINTSSWPKGIYQLQFAKGNAQHTISVLKQ